MRSDDRHPGRGSGEHRAGGGVPVVRAAARFAARWVLPVLALAPGADAGAAPVLYAGGATQKAADPALAGSVCLLDPATGDLTFLGDPTPTPGVGLSGLAFTPGGRLYGTTASGPRVATSDLLEIDPVTGGLVANLGTILVGGEAVKISDLAAQPGTGVLFGVSATFDAGSTPTAHIYTIDPLTGAATFVFDTGRVFGGGIAFTPAGELLQATFLTDTLEPRSDRVPGLIRYDPATGLVLGTVALNSPFYSFPSLEVHPTDGTVYATGTYEDPDLGVSILDLFVTIDPATGVVNEIARTGDRLSDLAFRPAAVPGPSGLVLAATAGLAGLAGLARRRRPGRDASEDRG
jgi:hypothetical protein